MSALIAVWRCNIAVPTHPGRGGKQRYSPLRKSIRIMNIHVQRPLPLLRRNTFDRRLKQALGFFAPFSAVGTGSLRRSATDRSEYSFERRTITPYDPAEMPGRG